MFKTSKRLNYTIKNNTHIFTQETTVKMSRGEKYTLTVQRTFNTQTGNVCEKFFKERTILNITRTLLGKSLNFNDWNVRKMERQNLISDETKEYCNFEQYFYDLPRLERRIEDNTEEYIKNFSKNQLKKLFKLDDTDEFFYLEGEEPQIHSEGETGDYLGSCFIDDFFRNSLRSSANLR